MGNDIIPAADRAITTPEGALALRRISCSMAWTEENPVEASRWLNPTLASMLPLATTEARSLLAPALGQHFKRFVSPTLALVAPAGMSEQDQRAWLATAAETLRGIPADLLERGCAAARRVCDHPAKILPAIFAEIGGAWDLRKRELARLGELEAIARTRPAVAAGDPYVRPEEATAIIDELGLRADAAVTVTRHVGTPRNPTLDEQREIARAVGVSTTSTAASPTADIAGLTITEIFARRDALRAGRPGQEDVRTPKSFVEEMDDVDRYVG